MEILNVETICEPSLPIARTQKGLENGASLARGAKQFVFFVVCLFVWLGFFLLASLLPVCISRDNHQNKTIRFILYNLCDIVEETNKTRVTFKWSELCFLGRN